MGLEDFEIYKLAKEISKEAWQIYEDLEWQDRKIMGDQFITAIDSISANIAEGFGRYHFLDKNKFNYNARGSLFESLRWSELLKDRNKIDVDKYGLLSSKLRNLGVKLNNHIQITRNQLIKGRKNN